MNNGVQVFYALVGDISGQVLGDGREVGIPFLVVRLPRGLDVEETSGLDTQGHVREHE